MLEHKHMLRSVGNLRIWDGNSSKNRVVQILGKALLKSPSITYYANTVIKVIPIPTIL